jgi:hypothetical protein
MKITPGKVSLMNASRRDASFLKHHSSIYAKNKRSAGNTNSMKRRFFQHKREYMSGNYTVLDVESAKRGERKEIWHGWGYAKKHQDEFLRHKECILRSVEDELASYHLFITEIADKRKQERIEFATIQNAYFSKEPWGDMVDGGMSFMRKIHL